MGLLNYDRLMGNMFSRKEGLSFSNIISLYGSGGILAYLLFKIID